MPQSASAKALSSPQRGSHRNPGRHIMRHWGPGAPHTTPEGDVALSCSAVFKPPTPTQRVLPSDDSRGVLIDTRVPCQRRESTFPKVRKPTCIALTVVVELRQLDSKVRLCSVDVEIPVYHRALVEVLPKPVEVVHIPIDEEANTTRETKSTLHGFHHKHPDVRVFLRGIGY